MSGNRGSFGLIVACIYQLRIDGKLQEARELAIKSQNVLQREPISSYDMQSNALLHWKKRNISRIIKNLDEELQRNKPQPLEDSVYEGQLWYGPLLINAPATLNICTSTSPITWKRAI